MTTTTTTEDAILAALSNTGPAMGFHAAPGAIARWIGTTDDLTDTLEAMVAAGLIGKGALAGGRGNPPIPAYGIAR